MPWTVVVTLPLMAAIQMVGARIGYTVGFGLVWLALQVFLTTISPCLSFWQAAQEVESSGVSGPPAARRMRPA